MSCQILTVPGLEDWVVEENAVDVHAQLEDGADWLSLTLELYDGEPLVVRSETVVAVKPL